MENKADVKAIMARFQANGSTSEDAPSACAGRPKQPLHLTTSGPSVHMKKSMLEGLPGSATSVPPKPSFLNHSPSSNSDTAVQEPNKPKALAGMFANSQEDMNRPVLKHKVPSKPSFTAMSEAKTPLNRVGLSAVSLDPKPAFPKPTVASTKPTWVKEDSTSSASTSSPKIPPLHCKPNNSFFKLQQQVETKTEVIADSVNKPSLPVNAAVKPSNFKMTQNLFNKDPPEQPDSVSNSIPPPKPPPSKKPSLKKSSPSTPKKNPLPNSLALGPAPAKPNRPPNVNLDALKKESQTSTEGLLKTMPPLPPSHPANHSYPVTAAPIPAPSLPPRHPGARDQTEELYDDVDGLTGAPPPLPPVHPSQMSKVKGESDDDGEMYEDLDDRWEAAEQQQEKKDDKEKKRLEGEKKEQREREKKEQEARKKFKLDGPLEVLQKGTASAECKGSKTDLSLKLGDSLDIIRIHGNPEGKWLGRTQDGTVGYVKIGVVKIDYNSLKQQTAEQANESEFYDDIEMKSAEQSKTKRVVSPPESGEEIYDDVDSNQNPRFPSTSPFLGESDHTEEIYDDVDSQMPSPSKTSMPKADPKKQKKLEKEEKEFRKKFKYEGEIKVLHQVTIIQNLTNKKWSSKELPLKAGEKLDVIVQAVNNKFICRNEDGKFGYVSTSYIASDDGDIYDDIGDDCIYDND